MRYRYIHKAKRGNLSVKLIGVGGCGCNTLKRLAEGPDINVDLIIVDSDDAMVFANGFDGEFRESLLDADMVFVLAGMGGRFGAENASLIAQAARSKGAAVVGFGVMPFSYEGRLRADNALHGIGEFQQNVDLLVRLSNDDLMKFAKPTDTMAYAFGKFDRYMYSVISAVTDALEEMQPRNIDREMLAGIMTAAGLIA